MKPNRKRLARVLHVLNMISDPDFKDHVVLGYTSAVSGCDTYRCVLGWYHHLYVRDETALTALYEPYSSEARRYFGLNKVQYVKLFGTGSETTDDPGDNEAQTKREMRQRIKLVEALLA
jgi:hypothetical protein